MASKSWYGSYGLYVLDFTAVIIIVTSWSNLVVEMLYFYGLTESLFIQVYIIRVNESGDGSNWR